MATREEILPLLGAKERELFDKSEKAGLPAGEFYNKLKQFEAAYPDSWDTVFLTWIKGSGDDRAKAERVAIKRSELKNLEVEMATKAHEDEEDFLDRRIAELSKTNQPSKTTKGAK